MNKLILPRQDENGEYYISYSQIKGWLALEGYNTKMLGKHEYMREYFFGEKFPDSGYGQFGTEVEGYICDREFDDMFTDEEKKTMEGVQTYGVFQKELRIPFDGFYLKGFIDDCNEDLTILRDFKTASEKSKLQYYEPTYKQLDIYALGVLKETGKLPEQLQVTIIGRKGNTWGRGQMYKGTELEGKTGRQALLVDNWVETIDKEVSEKRIQEVEKLIIDTAMEISQYYQTYLKLKEIVL